MDDKYDGGRYDPSLGICGALELKFDGFKLDMIGRSQIYSYPAASGKPSKNGKFIYTKDAQRASFGGPIPEGKY